MNKEPDRNQRKALGKGLSALLPARNKAEAPAPPVREPAPEAAETFENIPVDRIVANQDQPRGVFDDAKLEELAQSIRTHGVIQPITVRKVEGGEYQIIAGERRWRAAQLAGLAEIPAVVRPMPTHDLLEVALIENIQREDLNPMEIAAAFAKLGDEYHLSHEEIAKRTGKNRTTVTNFMRLLRLSDQVKGDLIDGSITMGHARALLNIIDRREQAEMSRIIREKGLTVRDTEAWVNQIIIQKADGRPVSIPGSAEKKVKKEEADPNVRAAVDEMAAALGTRVKLVARGKKAGRLEIEYYSAEDLERIYSVIVK